MLRLYVTNDSGSTQEIKEVIDSSWGETAVTFDNQPVRGPRVLGQINGTTINTWKEIDAVLEIVSFIVVNRPGYKEGKHKIKHHPVQMPGIDISSSFLRQRIKHGKSIQYLTVDAVVDYIQRYKLYTASI